jgi:hypothetical protein
MFHLRIKRHSPYYARHTLFEFKSSEVAKCFSPLQCSVRRLRCSRRTGRGLGPMFCNHTTSNTHNESQAVKGRTHVKGMDLSGLATLRLAWTSPRACRGGGETYHKIKIWTRRSDDLCVGKAKPQAEKICRVRRRRSRRHEESKMIDKNMQKP